MSHRFTALFVAGCVILATPATAQTPAGSAEAGQKKVAMCQGCHGIAGYKTAYPDVYHVPLLGGQQATYIARALQAYKSGERTHPSMRGIAAGLSDQDIADVAAYYAGAGK